MILKKKNECQIGFYSTFEEQLRHQHPLYILAGKIHWQVFEEAFTKLYSPEGPGKTHSIDGITINAQTHSQPE